MSKENENGKLLILENQKIPSSTDIRSKAGYLHVDMFYTTSFQSDIHVPFENTLMIKR